MWSNSAYMITLPTCPNSGKFSTVLLMGVLPNSTVHMTDVEAVERLCCKQLLHSASR